MAAPDFNRVVTLVQKDGQRVQVAIKDITDPQVKADMIALTSLDCLRANVIVKKL